jgi:hypothetical protein
MSKHEVIVRRSCTAPHNHPEGDTTMNGIIIIIDALFGKKSDKKKPKNDSYTVKFHC